MTEFLAGYMDPEIAEWATLGLAVAAALIVLYVLARSVGRARERRYRAEHARLFVVDAEEVDQRRRLVLIRRDDVEHLIMVGGPTDIVVETGIRRNAPQERQAVVARRVESRAVPAAAAARAQPPAASAAQPRPQPKAPSAPEPQPRTPAPAIVNPADVRPAPKVQPPAQQPPRTEPVATASAPQPAAPQAPAASANGDAAQARSPVLDEEIQTLLDQMGSRSDGDATRGR